MAKREMMMVNMEMMMIIGDDNGEVGMGVMKIGIMIG